MKKFFSLGLMVLFFGSVMAQDHFLTGAWTLQNGDTTIVLLLKDGYFTSATYTKEKFINTWGGPFKITGKTLRIKLEFEAQNNEKTGTTKAIPFSINNQKLAFRESSSSQVYSRIDKGDAPLAGVWKITGREQEGKLVEIHQTGPRKTLKMLTGTRFQWFAINPETKEFSGTGGGTYTFENGKYTEHILFFSRDNKRVGASLGFDGKIIERKWHHSGLSSKGDKIYEVWGKAGK